MLHTKCIDCLVFQLLHCIFLLVEILNSNIAHVEIIRVFHLSGNFNLILTIHIIAIFIFVLSSMS